MLLYKNYIPENLLKGLIFCFMLKVSGGVKRNVFVLKFSDDVSVCRRCKIKNTFYVFGKQAKSKARLGNAVFKQILEHLDVFISVYLIESR